MHPKALEYRQHNPYALAPGPCPICGADDHYHAVGSCCQEPA